MAENTVSQLTPTVKENSSIRIEFINENTPAVLSTDIALKFQKKHKHVLEEIRKIQAICPESFYGPKIRPVNYTDPKGEKRPAYLLTRDAFSLLAMGFTGPAAIRWKLKYIEAFNALEAAVLENRAELAREAGYRQGLDEARALPTAEAERKASYLEGLKEGQKYRRGRDKLTLLVRALDYRKKGLRQYEIARLLGMSRQRVFDLFARARKMGVAA